MYGKVCVVMSDVYVFVVLMLLSLSVAVGGVGLFLGARDTTRALEKENAMLVRKLAVVSDDMSFLFDRVIEIEGLVHGRTVLDSGNVSTLKDWVDSSLSDISRIEDFLKKL
jgi:hypothetical protein